jgi:3-methyladenine DNA glycosylase AlkD
MHICPEVTILYNGLHHECVYTNTYLLICVKLIEFLRLVMLIDPLQQQLSAAGDAKTKAWMEAYLKHSLPFRGLKLPQVRSIMHDWVKAEKIVDYPAAEQLELAFALIREPWGEDKLAGTLLIQEVLIKRKLVDWQTDLPKFAELFDTGHIRDWNTCDWFCVKVLNALIKQQGQACAEAILDWCHADNLWRRRASLVSFVNLAKHGERNFLGFIPQLLTACARVIQSPERFAQTGTGWVLRELGLADQEAVIAFIKTHSTKFSSEGLRYAIEKMPKSLQAELKQYRQEQLKAGAELPSKSISQ